jgi:uncharacterized protein YacL (UPF0231 family)
MSTDMDNLLYGIFNEEDDETMEPDLEFLDSDDEQMVEWDEFIHVLNSIFDDIGEE